MTKKYFQNDVDLYIKSLTNLSDHTVSNYRNDLIKFIGFIDKCGCKAWVDVNEKKAREYIVLCRELGLIGRSISRNISTIRGFFEWLKKGKIVFKNPLNLYYLFR